MPPTKKAAKKSVKKSAGKLGRSDPHPQANDLRRAYEHMGRLEVMRKALKPLAAEAVEALTKLAQSEIQGGYNKSAADLLRAAEHLSFATLAGDLPERGRLSIELKRSITEQFAELLSRADDHWGDREDRSVILTALYKSSRTNAVKALDHGVYHQALEFARAAEALAHVRHDGQQMLDAGSDKLELKGA